MDAHRVLALSRLSGRAGRTRRMQLQVHVQPVRLARRFLRNVAQPYSANLSQFLPAGETLAVYRDQAGTRSTLNREGAAVRGARNDNGIMTGDQPPTVPPASALPPTTSDLLSDVVAGLSADPRTL